MKRLVLVAGAVLTFAGVALAAPDCTTVRCTYVPVAVIERTPTDTPLPTETPTFTPTPTNTPGPTLTPSEVPTPDIPVIQAPCNANQPSQPDVGAQAWMSVLSPSRWSQTTICARWIISGGAVVRGAILHATAHYKTTDTDLGTMVAGNDGVAHISFNIGGATVGYTVIVDGTIGGKPFSTSFTPQ